MQNLATLPEKTEDILAALLGLSEQHGNEAVFAFLTLLASTEGRTEILKARMVLANRVVAEHHGDKRAAAEALGYWAKDRSDGRSQTITNFYKLVAGQAKNRAGEQLLTAEELAQ